MSSGFGPRSRFRLVGSERPVSACTVSCVSSGVLSSPLPNEYCTLNDSPWPKRLLICSVIDLNVDSPIDCTSEMWLKRGSRRVAALTVVLKIGRPSASVPIGLIRLASVTTGRSDPLAYIRPADAVMLVQIGRASCTLLCHVCATTNAGSISHGDCWATVPVGAGAGNAGAPGVVPLKL